MLKTKVSKNGTKNMLWSSYRYFCKLRQKFTTLRLAPVERKINRGDFVCNKNSFRATSSFYEKKRKTSTRGRSGADGLKLKISPTLKEFGLESTVSLKNYLYEIDSLSTYLHGLKLVHFKTY